MTRQTHAGYRTLATCAVLAMLVVGCSSAPSAGSPAGAREGGGRPAEQPAGRPRGTLTMAWAREPENLSPKFLGGAGTGEPSWVFSSFLTYFDLGGAPHPMMSSRIPTQENGDWVINADGTMVTTYRLRDNIRWHDGTPLSAEDFAFAYRVYRDPEIPAANREPERLMANVEVGDERTIVVTWAQPYIAANVLGRQELSPLPRHVLQEKYATNKARFVTGEEWTSGYIGTGPFRLERWEPGTRLTARAVPDWYLGPPGIATLEIRILPDANALLANLLAGDLDFASSPALSVTEAVVARDQWVARGEGYLRTWAARLRFMEFQYREVPNRQQALGDLRVRRALLHAVDRASLSDAITHGLGSVADFWVAPSDPLYAEIDRVVAKHPYDPNRALALLGEAGWLPRPAGLVANAAGSTLDMEVSSGSSEPEQVTILANNLRQAGINATEYVLPLARMRDREFRASFPGITMGERAVALEDVHLITARIPTPETGFSESNRGSFSDAEIDRLYHTAFTSFDPRVRRDATVALHRRLSEMAAYGPLYYYVDVLVAKQRVKGPVGHFPPQSGATWNIHEWELAE